MTMIERVARVLCRHSGSNPDIYNRWSMEPLWHAYRNEAREILAAMREPTEGMLRSAWGIQWDWANGRAAADDWRVMIDAALAEKDQ